MYYSSHYTCVHHLQIVVLIEVGVVWSKGEQYNEYW